MTQEVKSEIQLLQGCQARWLDLHGEQTGCCICEWAKKGLQLSDNACRREGEKNYV